MDVITGEARNSLSEEKLLRQHLDVNIVEGVMENGNDVIPIKLLDTDTISQAKEKILDVLYRNTPVSRRPQLSEVDLELRRGNAGIKLCDHDHSNERDGEWVKVNTLGHYKLDQMVSPVSIFLVCIMDIYITLAPLIHLLVLHVKIHLLSPASPPVHSSLLSPSSMQRTQSVLSQRSCLHHEQKVL